MGIACGLVPSPSALIVLLGAIGLGRTAFGVLLVIAYEAGMGCPRAGEEPIMVTEVRFNAHTYDRGAR